MRSRARWSQRVLWTSTSASTAPSASTAVSDSASAPTAASASAPASASVSAAASASASAPASAAASGDAPASEPAADAAASAPQPAHTLEDGTYFIRSCASTGADEVLDIMGGSVSDGGNLALYRDCRRLWQRFEVRDVGGGYYQIVCVNSWRALAAAGTDAGSNVCQMAQDASSAAQQWVIADSGAGDGSYTVVSRLSGLRLDVQGGRAGDSVNVWTWPETSNNGGAGQRFAFERAYGVKGHTLEDGDYAIRSAAGADQVLDVVAGSASDGAEVTTYANTDAPNQRWRVTDMGEGYYQIVCVGSWMALDAAGSGYAWGTDVTQWSQTAGDNQRWIVQDAGEADADGHEYYTVVSKSSGLYLDVQGGRAGDGVNVWTWGATGGDGQRFTFERMVDEGWYTVGSGDDWRQCLDVVASSASDCANVTLYHATGGRNQKWRVTHIRGQVYRLESACSGRALDAAGGAGHANVQQFTFWGNPWQEWRIDSDGRTWTLTNQATGELLDVQGGHAGDGVNVRTWEATGNNSGRGQHWLLAKTSVYKIYLSAGHGLGNKSYGVYDPGACANGYEEHTLAAELLERVATILRDKYHVDYVLNTDGGYYKSREQRAESLGCNAVLAIHFNANGGSGSYSIVSNVYAAPGSVRLMNIMHRHLIAGLGLRDLGTGSQELYSISGNLPGTILEICFIDNASDMATYEARKDAVANELAAGIYEAAQ